MRMMSLQHSTVPVHQFHINDSTRIEVQFLITLKENQVEVYLKQTLTLKQRDITWIVK